jgi:hypothetical protein
MRSLRTVRDRGEFMLWCVGVTLFAYAVMSISVTFFDQSYVLFCLLIGAVPGITRKLVTSPMDAGETMEGADEPLHLSHAI